MERKQVTDLMRSSKNEQEWSSNADKVKVAFGGDYPGFWFADIMIGGVYRETTKIWEYVAQKKDIEAALEPYSIKGNVEAAHYREEKFKDGQPFASMDVAHGADVDNVSIFKFNAKANDFEFIEARGRVGKSSIMDLIEKRIALMPIPKRAIVVGALDPEKREEFRKNWSEAMKNSTMPFMIVDDIEEIKPINEGIFDLMRLHRHLKQELHNKTGIPQNLMFEAYGRVDWPSRYSSEDIARMLEKAAPPSSNSIRRLLFGSELMKVPTLLKNNGRSKLTQKQPICTPKWKLREIVRRIYGV